MQHCQAANRRPMQTQANSTSVLIVCRDFLPYLPTLGGVIRVLKMAEFFESRGIKTFIVAAKGVPIDFFGYEELVGRLDVTYVHDAHKAYTSRRSVRARSTPGSSARKGLLPLILARVERFASSAVPPDPTVFFNGGIYKACLDLIEKHQIRNVIASSPPHSIQLVGYHLKRRLGSRINLIVDYRDSWNCSNLFRRAFFPTQAINLYLEKLVLRHADHLSYVSPPMLEKLERKFKTLPPHKMLVMNGFDAGELQSEPLTVRAPHAASAPLTIAHFGFFDSGPRSFRDPQLLLNAIENARLPIKMVVYGAYRNIPDALRINQAIEIRAPVPHAQATALMSRMDVLLLLHSEYLDSDEVVSGKLFDYIAARRPILVAGSPNMEAAKIVLHNRLGCVADLRDEEQLVATLRSMIESKRNGSLAACSQENAIQFTRARQYEKLLPALIGDPAR
jgi:glycosyltransferase involved in cell wall biosynthesis